MKREYIIFNAMTGIREDLVESAQRYRFRKRTVWRTLMNVAACLAVVAAVGYSVALVGLRGCGGSAPDGSGGAPPAANDSSGTEQAAPEEGTTTEAADEEAMDAVVLTATVREAYDGSWIVEPMPGEDAERFGTRVRVPLAGLKDVPAVLESDAVTIYCDGGLLDGEPPQLACVYRVELVGGC